jgi:hypothetical protein
MNIWKKIRHRVLVRPRVFRRGGRRLLAKKDKNKGEITPQQMLAIVSSIIIILMAIGGFWLVYDVFAQA